MIHEKQEPRQYFGGVRGSNPKTNALLLLKPKKHDQMQWETTPKTVEVFPGSPLTGLKQIINI